MAVYKWNAHWGKLSDEDRKALAVALPALKMLSAVLEDKVGSSERTQEGVKAYESPSWPYLQADHIATQRTLKEIIKIITPSDVNNT